MVELASACPNIAKTLLIESCIGIVQVYLKQRLFECISLDHIIYIMIFMS